MLIPVPLADIVQVLLDNDVVVTLTLPRPGLRLFILAVSILSEERISLLGLLGRTQGTTSHVVAFWTIDCDGNDLCQLNHKYIASSILFRLPAKI